MRKLFIIILAVAAFLAIDYFFSDKRQMPELRDMQVGQTLLRVEIADSLPKQIKGLSGRESICGDCGMVFIYQKPQLMTFWMQGMLFPLDMVFIREGKVVDFARYVPQPKAGEQPPRVESSVEADTVLEVNAGFVDQHGIKLGDAVYLDRR